MLAHTSPPGYHIVSVKGCAGEELTLLSSLPLGSRTPAEWLPVLERAIRVTLSCQLTESLQTVPEKLRFSSDQDHSHDTTRKIGSYALLEAGTHPTYVYMCSMYV